MKKLIAALLVVCVIFAGAIGYVTYKNHQAAQNEQPAPVQESAAPAQTGGTEETEEPEDEAVPMRLDLDALYASHEPDEVVALASAEIDGARWEREFTWDMYYYWLASYGADVQSYIDTMALYGMTVSWEDPWSSESDQSFAEYVVEATDETLRQIASIESFAEIYGVTLSEETLAQIEEQKQTEREAVCGEDATDEDWEAYLRSAYITPEIYDELIRINYLYQQGYTQFYGANGELLDDETALRYLEENDYLNANHILLLTRDMSTYEELDENTVADKKAKAEELAAELQAIEDTDELLARFAELKAEFDEDTGKEAYPDGYVFTAGDMVEEFESATRELADYQVSDPVLSFYGYHVILRLPLDVDSVLDYSSAGTPLTAKSLAANDEYALRMDEQMEKTEFTYASGFDGVALKDYLVLALESE